MIKFPEVNENVNTTKVKCLNDVYGILGCIDVNKIASLLQKFFSKL